MEYLFQKYLYEMVNMIKTTIRKKFIEVMLVLTSLVSVSACAVDNPDSEDVINHFEQREKSLLEKVDNPKNSNRAYLVAYDDYQSFLDKELNTIYKKLMSKLPDAQKSELKLSQRQWLAYRDAEFELIKNTWTRDSFGSSAGMTRGQYRCTIIRDRVIQLMHYFKSF